MKNFIVPGKSMPWANDTGDDVLSGGVVVIGNGIGIAMRNIPDGSTETVELQGVYELPIDSLGAVSEPDVIPGTPVWWDAAIGMCVGENVGGILPLAGVIFRTEQAASTSAAVLLVPFAAANGISVARQPAIADVAGANLTAVPGAFADVAAVRTYLLTLVPELETRLDDIEAKINTTLGELADAGVIEA